MTQCAAITENTNAKRCISPRTTIYNHTQYRDIAPLINDDIRLWCCCFFFNTKYINNRIDPGPRLSEPLMFAATIRRECRAYTVILWPWSCVLLIHMRLWSANYYENIRRAYLVSRRAVLAGILRASMSRRLVTSWFENKNDRSRHRNSHIKPPADPQ